MDVTEATESRQTMLTTYGSSFRRVFNALWTDWDNGTFDMYIGMQIGLSTLDGDFSSTADSSKALRVTQLGTRYVNETNCKIDVYYSTDNQTNQLALPDQALSWQEDFDIGSEEETTDIYYDFGSIKEDSGRVNVRGNAVSITEGRYNWKGSGGIYNTFHPAIYDSAGNTITTSFGNDAIPDLLINRGIMRHRLTTYGSTVYLERILAFLNYVNGVNFISRYYRNTQQTGITHDVLINFNDVGKWLFVGCPFRRVRQENWEYNFEFLYNAAGWNWQHGVRVNLYPGEYTSTPGFSPFDFLSLFDGMTGTDGQPGVFTGR